MENRQLIAKDAQCFLKIESDVIDCFDKPKCDPACCMPATSLPATGKKQIVHAMPSVAPPGAQIPQSPV